MSAVLFTSPCTQRSLPHDMRCTYLAISKVKRVPHPDVGVLQVFEALDALGRAVDYLFPGCVVAGLDVQPPLQLRAQALQQLQAHLCSAALHPACSSLFKSRHASMLQAPSSNQTPSWRGLALVEACNGRVTYTLLSREDLRRRQIRGIILLLVSIGLRARRPPPPRAPVVLRRAPKVHLHVRVQLHLPPHAPGVTSEQVQLGLGLGHTLTLTRPQQCTFGMQAIRDGADVVTATRNKFTWEGL